MHGILEAPVPFLVGLSRAYLDTTPAMRRPPGVVFVDLDDDRVHLGVDEEAAEGMGLFGAWCGVCCSV